MSNDLCNKCKKQPVAYAMPVIDGYVLGGNRPPIFSRLEICKTCFEQESSPDYVPIQKDYMPKKLTPLDIEVLMKHYRLNGELYKAETNEIINSLRKLIDIGLLIENNLGNGTWNRVLTEGGRMLVEALCSTPLPVQKWVMPNEWSIINGEDK